MFKLAVTVSDVIQTVSDVIDGLYYYTTFTVGLVWERAAVS